MNRRATTPDTDGKGEERCGVSWSKSGQSAPKWRMRCYFADGGRISRGGTLNALASFHMVRSVIERPASMRW